MTLYFGSIYVGKDSHYYLLRVRQCTTPTFAQNTGTHSKSTWTHLVWELEVGRPLRTVEDVAEETVGRS